MSDRDDFNLPKPPHPDDRAHGVFKDPRTPASIAAAVVEAAPFPKETTDAMELQWWRTAVGPRLPPTVKVFGAVTATMLGAPAASIFEETGEPAIAFVREPGNNEEAFWEDVYLAAMTHLAGEQHSSRKADILAAAYADRAVLAKRARREPR